MSIRWVIIYTIFIALISSCTTENSIQSTVCYECDYFITVEDSIDMAWQTRHCELLISEVVPKEYIKDKENALRLGFNRIVSCSEVDDESDDLINASNTPFCIECTVEEGSVLDIAVNTNADFYTFCYGSKAIADEAFENNTPYIIGSYSVIDPSTCVKKY